jgi:hypothetical protein
LADTREVLYLVNRPGNAPSHADATTWIDKAIALVHPYAKRVCLRGDTGFSLTANFDRWAQQVDFVLGTDNIAALRTRAEALHPSAWQRLQRPAPYENQTGATRVRRHNRNRRSSKNADISICNSITKTSPSSPTAQANASVTTASWWYARTSAASRANKLSSRMIRYFFVRLVAPLRWPMA